MRFDELFINYKIGLKDIGGKLPFSKLSNCKKIFIILLLIGLAGILISPIIFKVKSLFMLISIILSIVSGIKLYRIVNDKNDIHEMLKKHYIPYSEKRMNMLIEILKKYNINIENLDSIDLLIKEAEYAQAESDFFANFKNPFKILGSIIFSIISIIGFDVNKFIEANTPTQILNTIILVIFLILPFFTLISFIIYIIKEIFYREYNMYKELIYDLRQIKIFYQKKF